MSKIDLNGLSRACINKFSRNKFIYAQQIHLHEKYRIYGATAVAPYVMDKCTAFIPDTPKYKFL